MGIKKIIRSFPKRTAIIPLLLLILFQPLFAENAGERLNATVGRVINGNTFITSDWIKFRLIDIRLPADKSARHALEKYLKTRIAGKRVQLEHDSRKHDSDGVQLVYLFMDGKLINAEILAAGLTKMKSNSVNKKYQRYFFQSQAKAYKSGIGIWKRVGNATESMIKKDHDTVTNDDGTAALHQPIKYERVTKGPLILAERINNEGVESAEKGNLTSAIDSWRRSAQLMPGLYEPNYNMARANLVNGSYADAEEIIKKLIEEEHKDPRLLTMLGKAYLGRGKPDAALEMHKEALEQNPNLYEAQLNAARTYQTIGNSERALYEYGLAKSMKPEDPYLYFNIGNLYEARGEQDKAVEYYNKSLERNPNKAFISELKSRLQAIEDEKGLPLDVLRKRLLPAMVQIRTTKGTSPSRLSLERPTRTVTRGAGFIINRRGEIITSARLVRRANSIRVRVYDPNVGAVTQTLYRAEIVASRRTPEVDEVPFFDFALIKLDSPPNGLISIEMGSAAKVNPETPVYTMGYPGSKRYSLLQGTLTDIIDLPGDEKQRIRMISDYPAIKSSPVKKIKLFINDLGIDEQLRGSPLINNKGQVIGLNVMGMAGYKGESISIDIDTIRKALRR